MISCKSISKLCPGSMLMSSGDGVLTSGVFTVNHHLHHPRCPVSVFMIIFIVLFLAFLKKILLDFMRFMYRLYLAIIWIVWMVFQHMFGFYSWTFSSEHYTWDLLV